MPLVTVDGLNLWAEVAGSGPPVVLLHGFTGTSGTWSGLVDAMGGRYTTIAFDHIGHGRSDAPEAVDRYRMDRAVDDLVAAVGLLGHERAAWVGYSLGGRTALQVACRHPEAVAALVVEGASPGLATVEEREARIEADERLARLAEDEGLEAFVDYWQSIPLWASQAQTLTPEQHAALRQQRLGQRPAGLAYSLRGMGTGSQAWLGDRLGDIDVPVLLTAGRLDTRYVQAAEQMAALIPDSRVQIIDDAGHAAHLERPEAFQAVVLEFLDAAWPAGDSTTA
ncbi:MAG: 2-succinyl-6-hydroxy-2,4-cyclohexadiene-1-carboxylate synthase [Chloroflexi bacterium]|nr:2-succinyl-6-hydroxy-2,4-cyclohexadiene-1-carboxylate synthase [Chloroflexota bacterium]MQC48463.1 2-succinyl-6-hydroxy-2,4-cyclohexadiene-1-carboxylate synthase [Chloroflexota bacterium]